MAGQHALTVEAGREDAPSQVGVLVTRPLSLPCPFDTSCDGCGMALRNGWPVRPTTGPGPVVTGYMCCPCWWDRML